MTPATYRRRRLAFALLALGVVVVAARAGVALGGDPLADPERRPASFSVQAGGTASPGLDGMPADATAAAADVAVTADAADGTVVVRSGDTLWSIVSRLAPDEDPRPLVDELSDARGGAPLQPGERIRLPA